MSKLCHVRYHSTRTDGIKVFMLLCFLACAVDQKAIATNETNDLYEKGVFTILRNKCDVIFLPVIFRSSTHRRRNCLIVKIAGSAYLTPK